MRPLVSSGFASWQGVGVMTNVRARYCSSRYAAAATNGVYARGDRLLLLVPRGPRGRIVRGDEARVDRRRDVPVTN
jgi:hypothetical protein